jgi:hypothetical protein
MSVKAICSSVLHLVLVGLVALVCSGPAYAQDTLEFVVGRDEVRP